MKKKLIFAVGGTGGHLFPAQALARELQQKHEGLKILFAGARLTTNPFFHKDQFLHREIKSGSPYSDGALKAGVLLGRGIQEGLQLLKEYQPDLVVGFGSFYSFPLLAAAKWKKTPFLLVETNSIPGKVNRMFSARASLSALQFEGAAAHLKGKSKVVDVPVWAEKKGVTREEALAYYGFKQDLFTLLIFGGSQGAHPINQAAASCQLDFPYQVIHFTPNPKAYEEYYAARGVIASVKPFEANMHYAFSACDLAICRSGASTLSELIAFEVPSILVPWPGALENHQKKNAQELVSIGGARLLEEENLDLLSQEIQEAKEESSAMRKAIQVWKKSQEHESLAAIVLKELERTA